MENNYQILNSEIIKSYGPAENMGSEFPILNSKLKKIGLASNFEFKFYKKF